MSADKETIFKNAQKYAAKGNHDKAIGEWKKLIQKTPNDGNIFNSIGDLYIKKKSIPEAVKAFLEAANTFEKAGFSLKTIAVYKKILKFDPKRFDVYLKLGDINANRGLVSNAIGDYLKAGKNFVDLGKVREGVDVFKKITQLDPTNISIRIKLAEMCLKEGFKTEAIAEYVEIADFYSQGGKKDEAIRTCEQILEIDSSYSEAKILKGKLLGEIVEEPLSPVIEDGENSEQEDVASTGSMIIPTHDAVDDGSEAGVKEENPAQQIEQEGFEISPETGVQEDVSLSFGGDSEESINVPVLELNTRENNTPELEIPESSVLDLEDNGLPTEASTVEELSDHTLADFKEEPEGALEEVLHVPENIDDLNLESKETGESLDEADVYSKHGMSQDTVDQYKKILRGDPYNINAHSKLIEIYKNEDKISEAVMEHLKLAKIYEMNGENEKYDQSLRDALLLDPNHAQAKMMARVQGEKTDHESEVVEEAQIESTELEVLSETNYPEYDDSLSVDSLSIEEVFSEAESVKGQKVEGKDSVVKENKSLDDTITFQSLSSEEIAERLSEGEFYLQQGLKEEAKKIYQLILSAEPNHTAARDRLMELEVEEEIEREISGLPDSQMFEEIAEAEKSQSLGRSDLEYEPTLSQNVHENSGVNTEASSENSLNDTSLRSNRGKDASTSEIGVETNTENEDFVNLSDFLEEELGKEVDLHEISQSGTFNNEIDSAFKDFQKGIKEQFGEEDYETHYDLGIAYKEMGLLNEAISEFELSVKGKDRFIDSCNMLSICFMEKGENSQAIQHLVNALESPLCIGKNELWLKYELGELYEREGLYKQAFQFLNQVKQEEEGFKDVNTKIENLQKILRNQSGDSDSQFIDTSSDLKLGNSEKQQAKLSEKKRRISYL